MIRDEINGQIAGLQRQISTRPGETDQVVRRLTEEANREMSAIRQRTLDDIAARRTQGDDEVRVRRDQLSNAVDAERDRERSDLKSLNAQLESAKREQTRLRQTVA